MNSNLQDLLRSAAQLTHVGRLTEATAAIQRALGGAGRVGRADEAAAEVDSKVAESDSGSRAEPMVLDGCVFEVPGTASPTAPKAPSESAAVPPVSAGFTSGVHTHGGLTRAYKLFVPPGGADKPRALVVMLHGCTQNPDDFAAGTDMNASALEQGFAVLYPAQAQDANPSRCWNWFKHNHQQRGRGEPALIASLTRQVIEEQGIDPHRVYVAGLSAGGAMASILAEAYPDLYAAAGVHSGLPPRAASSVPEALSVMNSGAANAGARRRAHVGGAAAAMAAATPSPRVPTIVFHGDQDRTVHPSNGEQVIAAALGAGVANAPTVEQGRSAQGRRYTRSIYADERGSTQAEHWRLHGAGHAWSGGRSAGSYTDASGPDATREMLRFFFEHPLLPTR